MRNIASSINWPEGKDFAFTVFDDTDHSTVANTKPVYDFLNDQGFHTTKSVWPLKGPNVPKVGGTTCEDQEYRAWVQSLQELGYEIGYHCATYHTSSRHESELGLERFRELFGHYPRTHANHTGCQEGIYWGSARLGGVNRLVYNLLTRFRNDNSYFGQMEGHELFWGDLCKQRITYVRNFSFADVNTLKQCPQMPYHDQNRPYVNYWFASSEGTNVDTFCRCISEPNQEQLESERGACIMYAHFASGFSADGILQARFRSLMERLSRRNGWFVPVATLLDFLLETKGHHDITASERSRLERRWLGSKLSVGPS